MPIKTREPEQMPTYQDILKQIDQLTKEAERVRQTEVSSVIADIRSKMAQYGIQLSDLAGKATATRRGRKKASGEPRASSGPRAKVPPKYRGSNGELWSGRGRRPAWVEAELAKGKSIDELLI